MIIYSQELKTLVDSGDPSATLTLAPLGPLILAGIPFEQPNPSDTVIFVSLGIVAANGFFIGMAIVIIIFIRLVLIPKEEAHLIEKFGAEYDEYKKRTGMLSPRLGLLS